MSRPRLHIHAKLLMAFSIILLPVLILLIAGFLSDLQRTRQTILVSQSMTARSVAVQVSEVFDSAIGLGWAIAQDPMLRTLDPQVLDPHLKKMVTHSPLYDSIGVYDANGVNRGWGDPSQPATPRLNIRDRRYFQQVMAANVPIISEVLELKRPTRTGLVACIPIRGPQGTPIGVVNIMIRSEQLAYRFVDARLQQDQMIFLADSQGRLAFHTGSSHLPYRQSDALMELGALREAASGIGRQLDRFTNPFIGDEHMGAFAPVPRYPWAVGVSIPRDVALAPLFSELRVKLLAFTGILLLNALLAFVLARFYARPVHQLRAAAQALERGDRDATVRIHTGDEMEDLGNAFNAMATEVIRREEEVNALHKEAERQALELAAIIASVPDGIFLAGRDGRLVGTNPSGLRLLGLKSYSEFERSLPEYLQRYDIRHPDGRPLEAKEMPVLRALSGETFTDAEIRLRSLDGKQRLLSVNGAPVRDASGQIILGEVVIRDITARKQAEDDLARLLDQELALARIGQALVSEVELERIAQVFIEQCLHSLGVDALGLWLAEPERQELTLIASHRLGVREQLHHLPFDAPVLTAHAALTKHIQTVEDTQSEEECPASCMLTEEPFRGIAALPLLSQDRLVGVMTCCTYAPRRFSSRELEFYSTVGRLFAVAIEKARLFQQVREALRLREEFMSAAAHELKTPVTTIQTWAEMLLHHEDSTPRQKKGLTAIMRNTRRIARLVEHLFTAVRMAPGPRTQEHETFDLLELIRERVENLARTTENPISIEASGPLFVQADRQFIGDVVTHLLENAVRYSFPGQAIEIKARRQDEEVVVSVHDQDPGIPPERQPHVFEPLYEPLPPGAQGYTGVVGLGLHLSRQMIEAQGGRIWVASSPEAGSTFSFSLPLVPAPSGRDFSPSRSDEDLARPSTG
ncbi:cache domain-containing protein [Hyalangium rubrum]|uniref:histidine kinase n=1 Tax=Hyalangium rubrum TaxID=3103134 RepID=A0ABU5HCS2_9BACT|nr:cache domain-containing protein [Hyalangium sp. s54d21]MDY7231060.1 cache domain-containing protein [Hyalangium sp. s54d21]